jgi:hypothetical protein
MTVTPLKKAGLKKASTTRPSPRPTCTWVAVRGEDGRTRMEMRWLDETRRAARHAA